MCTAILDRNDGLRRAAIDRHVERFDDELFAHVVDHCPADDTTAGDVKHDGTVEEAIPRLFAQRRSPNRGQSLKSKSRCFYAHYDEKHDAPRPQPKRCSGKERVTMRFELTLDARKTHRTLQNLTDVNRIRSLLATMLRPGSRGSKRQRRCEHRAEKSGNAAQFPLSKPEAPYH